MVLPREMPSNVAMGQGASDPTSIERKRILLSSGNSNNGCTLIGIEAQRALSQMEGEMAHLQGDLQNPVWTLHSPRSRELVQLLNHSKYAPALIGTLMNSEPSPFLNETHPLDTGSDSLSPSIATSSSSSSATADSSRAKALRKLNSTEKIATAQQQKIFNSIKPHCPLGNRMEKKMNRALVQKFSTAENFICANLDEQDPHSYALHSGYSEKKGQLPEEAVKILHSWLLDNFSNPYPSDEVKEALAREANVEVKQVSNWFGNARVRLWRPVLQTIVGGEEEQPRKPKKPRKARTKKQVD